MLDCDDADAGDDDGEKGREFDVLYYYKERRKKGSVPRT
jgi:hypothetical protein